MVGDLAVKDRATFTRRGHVPIFKGFHRLLQARKAVEIEIEAEFVVRLVCPVDEFNTSRHVGDDSPALLPPLNSPDLQRTRRAPRSGPLRHPSLHGALRHSQHGGDAPGGIPVCYEQDPQTGLGARGDGWVRNARSSPCTISPTPGLPAACP
nr:hypothetical protein [Streptomyces sp. RPA4-2]